MNLVGTILLIIGLGFIIIGSAFILISRDFYHRLLVCTYIDTIGMILMLLGLLCRYYHQLQPLKIILLLLITLCINPVSTYALGRCAYMRGERPKKEDF